MRRFDADAEAGRFRSLCRRRAEHKPREVIANEGTSEKPSISADRAKGAGPNSDIN
jgi:hypothetical protein